MKPEELTPAARFFFDNAGFSYNPATETEEAGRIRCALALAEAEEKGEALGYCVRWGVDPDVTSADWVEDGQPGSKGHRPWHTWQATCYGPTPEDEDEEPPILASLGGIDFGRNGEPFGDNYARVIRAELFAEALG